MNIEIKNLFNFEELRIQDHPDGTRSIILHMWLKSQETGETVVGTTSKQIPIDADLSQEVKKLMLAFYEHEIDEALHVDGKRLHDPHFCPTHQKQFALICRECNDN